MKRPIRTAGVLFLLVLMAGCQLPTATYFKDEVFPQDPVDKALAFPLLFPFYAILTMIDITLVNPARGAMNVPQVAADIWDWHNEEDPWIGYGMLMPIKLVGIPLAAAGTTIFSEQFEMQEGGPTGPDNPTFPGR